MLQKKLQKAIFDILRIFIMAAIFRGKIAIFMEFYRKIVIFPLKIAAIMEILKI